MLKNTVLVLAILVLIYAVYTMVKFKRVTRPLRRRKCDPFGCGHFQASRTNHVHQGQDFLVSPGEKVFAPISGKIRIAQPYASDPRFSGVEITGVVYRVKVFYFEPSVSAGEFVIAGQEIGTAQDLGIKYSGIPNHLHVEVRRTGKNTLALNPSTYFPVDDVLVT